MTTIRISILSFVLAWVFCPAADAESTDIGFARSLHAQGDFYRAITEYKRALFTCPDESSSVRDEAILGIGGALYSGEEFSRSAEWLRSSVSELSDSVSRKSGLRLLYRSLLSANDGEEIPAVMRQFDDNSSEARLYVGLSAAQQGRWTAASMLFDSLRSDSAVAGRAAEFLSIASEGYGAGWKSTTKASILGILPGAGYWYSGHKQTAIASFVVNAVFIGATAQAFDSDQDVLGGFLAVVSLSWYAGNIFGSAQAAHRYNQNLQSRLWGRFRY
jgi:hypothetical protein